MLSKTKKAASTIAASALAAAALAVTVPGTAFAMNEVECTDGEDYVKIWSHHSWGMDSVDCYANAGEMDFGDGFWWIDKVSTGNNTFTYHDDNGEAVTIDPWNVKSFPNNPPRVHTIEIQ